jgi:hypothetical protein
MSEIIGVYSLDDSFSEHMSLTLYPDSFAVRWSLCNLTANFMAEYFGELFPEIDGEDRLISRDEVSGAIGYVLNELVENAVKFNQHGDITVTVGIGREDLVCLVSNQITNAAVPSLREKLLELTQEDPGELLRRQAEANAEDAENAGSGLGYLIIMNDYGVSLGWKLDPISVNSFSIKTMARIPILNERSRMEIKGGNYRVWYDPSEVVVYLEGILRLGGTTEYAPIEELLELTQEDPGELLRRQAEANAEDAENAGSGLGYLIIMNDYGVSLGWKLDPISVNSFSIKTMARIPILNERSRMEIKGGNYRVWYDPSEVVVYLEGILRLGGTTEYAPIEELLDKVLATNPPTITLDVRALNFLNSSGINVLYKFAIATRKKGELQLIVRGSKSIPWQGKSLPNLKKFNQNFEMILCD